MSEYIIINKSFIENKIKDIKRAQNRLEESSHNSISAYNVLQNKINLYNEILDQSTPLIPEIEKAMNVAREIKDDSVHDTFTVDDISGCTEVCTYGWRYKTTNVEYISNLKII